MLLLMLIGMTIAGYPFLPILPEPDLSLASSVTVSLQCLSSVCHPLLPSSVSRVPPLPVEIRISAAMTTPTYSHS